MGTLELMNQMAYRIAEDESRPHLSTFMLWARRVETSDEIVTKLRT